MPKLIAGWTVAYCLIWLTWATLAPIIAEAKRVPPVPQTICPRLEIIHGVGSDLKTFTRAIDLCRQKN